MTDAAKKVLMVEDDALLRGALAAEFEAAGFAVVQAKDAEEGLALFASEKPDACVIDVMLPGKSGLEMVETIRSEMPGSSVPLFFLTDAQDMDYLSRAVESGVQGYIRKSDTAAAEVVKTVSERLS